MNLLTWTRDGELFTRWHNCSIPASRFNREIDGGFVVEVFQKWRANVLGFPIWTRRIVVGTLDVNQWIARVPLGDTLLTPEQRQVFNRPALSSQENESQSSPVT